MAGLWLLTLRPRACLSLVLLLALHGSFFHAAASVECIRPLERVLVKPNGVTAGCCGLAGNECGTLEAAFSSVISGGTVELTSGIHLSAAQPGQPISIPLEIVTIQGPSTGPPAILDCGNGPCLEAKCTLPGGRCPQAKISLKHLTVQKGSAVQGGCLNAVGYSVDLGSVVFQNCTSATAGGAVSVSNAANALLKDVSFETCSANAALCKGGALFLSGVALTSLSNINAQGCQTAQEGYGGAIYAFGGQLSLSDSTFGSCVSNFSGGALFTSNATVSIDSVQFDQCMANVGGSFTDYGSDVTVKNVTMTSSFANYLLTGTYSGLGGGAEFNYSKTVTISHSKFSLCSSSNQGGALDLRYMSTVAAVEHSTFEFSNTGDQGGAINAFYTPGITLDNCTFSASNVTGNPMFPIGFGSAIFSYNSSVNVSRSRFLGNDAAIGGYDSQGAIALQNLDASTKIYISKSEFRNNKALQGAAICNPGLGHLIITDCDFYDNGGFQYTSQGGAVLAYSSISLSNCTFVNNGAQNGGGAVLISQTGTLEVQNCTFSENGIVMGDGGAVLVNQAEIPVFISDSHFSDNAAFGSRGGALFSASSAFVMKDTNFVRNTANTYGGAVSVLASKGTKNVSTSYSLTRCNFSSNVGPLGGGAIYSGADTEAAVHDCSFFNNSGSIGGAIMLQGFSNFTVSASSCLSNQATTGGGCLSATEESAVDMAGCVLDGNRGASEGGAMRLSGLSSIRISNSSLSGNSAAWGGVVWSEMESRLFVTNTSFTQNTAQFQGGVIYNTHTASIAMQSSRFTLNKGPYGGAIVADASSLLVADNCHFNSNSLSALLIQGFSNVNLTGCTFGNNTNVNGVGGAMTVTDEAVVGISGSTFSANVAKQGGGIFVDGEPTVVIASSTFASNIAQVGAGLVLSGAVTATVSGSTFSLNKASSAGGGVAVMAQTQGSLTHSQFLSNYASVGGAGVYVQRISAYGLDLASRPFTMDGLTFSNNSGPSEGGVAFFDATYNAADRAVCQNCVAPAGSLGTIPMDLDISWTGIDQSLKAANAAGTDFVVLTAVGTPITGLMVTIKDLYGNTVTQDNSSLALVSPDARISGLLRGTAVDGIVSIPPINVYVTPETATTFNVTVAVTSPDRLFPDFSRTMSIGFCPAGEYFNATVATCELCNVGFWCAAGQPMQPCPDGTFSFYPGASDENADCIACDDNNLDCTGGVLQVAYQAWLDPQSLNSTPTSYPCIITNGCNGYTYVGPTDPQCLNGYSETVPMCSLCLSGYYFFLGYCQQCTQVFKDVFFVLLAVVIVAWVCMVVLADLFLCVDVFLNELQLLVLIGSCNLNYPAMWMMRIFQLYNLSVFDPDLIGPQCWFNYSFTQRFYVSMAIPFVGLAMYAIAYGWHLLSGSLFVHVHSFRTESFNSRVLQRSVSRRRQSNDYFNSVVHACTNWLDICYIMIISRVFSVFQPQVVGDTTVLAMAPQIIWLSPEHIGMFVTAILFLIFYVAGLPALYAYVLFDAHRTKSLNSTEFRQKYGWLTERYKRSFWWWHLVNVALRIIHAAVFVFLISQTNVQVVIFLPIQALRIAMQWKSSSLSSLSLDYLQASLTLGEFMFTLSLVCYNFINLDVFSQILFGISTVLMLGPFIFTFAYEAINKHLEMRNNRLLARIWKMERKRNKNKFEGMDPYDLVNLHEVSEWFRPHVVFALLVTKRASDRRLLVKVRDRVQACKVVGLSNVDWVNHLKKPQLYALLSQALLGASAGHITVARIPRNGMFCKQHGVWHTQEECTGQHGQEQDVAPVTKAGVAWPPTLERHVSWGASQSGSMDLDAQERERSIADAVRKADGVKATISLTSSEGTGTGTPSGMLTPTMSDRQAPGTPVLSKAPSIRVQNLKVKWGGAGAASGTGTPGGMRTPGGDEEEYVEAKMNMTELTLTFQRHLSLLVHSEKKKKVDSLRLLIRSEFIPIILSWLTSPGSNQEDQKLLRKLVVAVREAAVEEAGGLDWWKGALLFYSSKVKVSTYTQEYDGDQTKSVEEQRLANGAN